MPSKIQYMIMGALLTVFLTLAGLVWLQTSVSAEERNGSESILISPNEIAENKSHEERVEVDRRVIASSSIQPAATATANVVAEATTNVAVEAEPIGWLQSTDPSAILERLRQLSEQQTNDMLGQEGWLNVSITGPELHESNAEALQDYQGPEGQVVPAEEMYPIGSGRVSRWYYVNKEGLLEQGLTFTSDANEQMYQLTVLQGEKWINMALKEHGFDEDVSSTWAVSNQISYYLPIQEAIQFLEVALLTESNNEEISVSSYEENGRYHLMVYSTFATPIELGYPFPEPIMIGERHFIFDGINGHLLMDNHNFTLKSGEVFQAGIAEYHISPLLPQLPNNVQQLLDNAAQVIRKETK